MGSDSALIVFTLSPEAEARRKGLGMARPEQAARVFRVLRDHILSTCSELDGVDLLIATSDGARPRPGYLPQRGASFGESLKLAVEDAFSLGYRRVVVIGNDSPEISRAYLQDAFRCLAGSGRRAVIGPAHDGGYALLGLTAGCPSIFEAMPWGSSAVGRLTKERLTAHGFLVQKIGTVADIDNPWGLARFLVRARKNGFVALARCIAVTLSPVVHGTCRTPRRRRLVTLTGLLTLRAPPFPLA